jgi:hypothetical protein
MKRIALLIALITCVTLGVSAQGKSLVQSLYSNAASGVKLTDTVTNTGTVTMSSAIVAGAPEQTTVTATFTKLTGTVAGTATLLGSVNGTDWTSASATNYTVTDVASATTSWPLTGKNFLYYRVNVVGSGTSTYTVKGQVLTVIHP